jgi:hypothetical protein
MYGKDPAYTQKSPTPHISFQKKLYVFSSQARHHCDLKRAKK